MPVISVANPKGGAGKTTLVLVLADQLSQLGASVAVIDADPNAIIAKWAAKREKSKRMIPYTVVGRPEEKMMIKTVENLAQDFDFVLIDLEGTASQMTTRAMARSHLILIPFNQSPIDAELAATAVSLITDSEELTNRRIPYRLVRSRDSAAIATKTSKRIAAAIEAAELPLLSIGLVERAAYRDIYEYGSLLSELDPMDCKGIDKAQENARQLVHAVVEAVREETSR